MKKDSLERANEIMAAITKYKNIYRIAMRPYMKFVLRKQKCLFTAESYTTVEQEGINDPALAKLIQDYCDRKIQELTKELEEL